MVVAGSKLKINNLDADFKFSRVVRAVACLFIFFPLILSGCDSPNSDATNNEQSSEITESEITEGSDIETRTFTNSDGSTFTSKAFYPNFNWDTTPIYSMFGASWTLLESDQEAFISERSDFITIEKHHGASVLGYAEFGAQYETEAFKALDPGNTVLYYFNAAYAWPFTSYNEYFTAESIDEHPELKAYLLTDESTGELYDRNGVYFFDVLNKDFRHWWVDAVVDGVKVAETDGVFIDQMHGFSYLRWDQREDVYAAMGEMMSDLKASLPTDTILLANNGADVELVFPSADAFMFEHYNEDKISKENLLKEWDDMLHIAQAGKISVFRIGVDIEANVLSLLDGMSSTEKTDYLEQYSLDRAEYFLSVFLIGAQPYSYFQYGWGFSLYDGGSLVDYPLFSKPLGKPLNTYTRLSVDRWEFSREFEYASVWVNTETGESKITWK